MGIDPSKFSELRGRTPATPPPHPGGDAPANVPLVSAVKNISKYQKHQKFGFVSEVVRSKFVSLLYSLSYIGSLSAFWFVILSVADAGAAAAGVGGGRSAVAVSAMRCSSVDGSQTLKSERAAGNVASGRAAEAAWLGAMPRGEVAVAA